MEHTKHMNFNEFKHWVGHMVTQMNSTIYVDVRIRNCKIKCITDDYTSYIDGDVIRFKATPTGKISTDDIGWHGKFYIRHNYGSDYMLCDKTEHMVSIVTRKYKPIVSVLSYQTQENSA